ncbi:MAG: hypothetical protein ACKO5W_08765 [Crocinitomicaceae bacterium]
MSVSLVFFPLQSKRFSTDFSILNDWTNKLQFFTGIDILMSVLWLIISIIILQYIKSLNREKEHYKYYMWNFYFRLIFNLAFSFYFIYFVKGGDTVAYWDASVRLTNLLYLNPENFFNELFQFQGSKDYVNYFNNITGIPPNWIAKEKEAYFCAKVFSFFNIFTNGSFFALSIITTMISSIASFHLFDFIKKSPLFSKSNLAVISLFIPSVAFWCSGIGKDMIVYSVICIMIPILFTIGKEKQRRFSRIIILIFCLYLLYNIRSFMILVMFLPLFFTYNLKISEYLFQGKFARQVFRILFIGLTLVSSALFIGNFASEQTKNAEIQQNDFNSNAYKGKKYSVGDADFSYSGILKMSPFAIFAGILRPLPWEALTPGLIINGLESLLIIFLAFRFYRKKSRLKLSILRNNDLLVYFIYFVLILALITGITSVLFGVLVRVRAPLIPFVFLMLLIEIFEENTEDSTLIT